MGGHGSGRKMGVEKFFDRPAHIVTVESEPLILPNRGGDHSAGSVLETPVNDTDIANKKYVDDNVSSPNDTAYNATTWNANSDAATKNAIRDQVEVMIAAEDLNTTHRSSDGSDHSKVTANETAIALNTTHAGDNSQAHSDYLKNDAADVGVGLTLTADNSSNDAQYTAQVLHGTDATPPAASGFPIGTIYIQYTA